ncbi:D-erythronate dehydrogenase [Actibacterium sp. 188UL27-1]|uniref:D-erythronate dehydrogenase n=1 Tax=Actibacterium sp. 188UL27-1 TaxID=2786961 RepID=UPI00195DF28C|nr:D-erythronate dehydrogenase [Actibacterium sp. 188UL27-1]MBM7066832.1 SDR family oxidoreductase [Actibacterium sp. 188UL27-1]
MKTLIIGGGGMIGQKLARKLADARDDVILYDVAYPPDGAPAGTRLTGNLADDGQAKRLAELRPDVIYHLAAVVSGEAEENFDLGWQVNMMGTWALLEALRAEHIDSAGAYRPRLVFTSSIAVFGAPFPDHIDDTFLSAPQTSYGAQKACCELMVTDFSRKGFIDGLSLRLPTICVRPGKPNKAASGFFSGIIREPLNGVEAILPVPDTVRHWHASPRAAIGFLTHAAALDTDRLEGRRALSLPGVSCTIAEQIEALKAVAGNDIAKLIRREPDPAIEAIVKAWPRNFAPERAISLGFRAEPSFRRIIQVYMDDDLATA